jgi:hypothetical protein
MPFVMNHVASPLRYHHPSACRQPCEFLLELLPDLFAVAYVLVFDPRAFAYRG